jgi:hypothetical protein
MVGYECVHVCVDDATRLAYAEVLADERATTAIAFPRRCLAFYRDHGIRVKRVMTENGPAYVSAAFAIACRALRIKHSRTRPYRPETNGEAERHPVDDAGVGLRDRLRLLRGADRGATAVARALQHDTKTRRPRSPTAVRAARGAPEGTTWLASTGRGTSATSRSTATASLPRSR